jgi:hypothetical protein
MLSSGKGAKKSLDKADAVIHGATYIYSDRQPGAKQDTHPMPTGKMP